MQKTFLFSMESIIIKGSFITGYHVYKIRPTEDDCLDVVRDPQNKHDKNGWAFEVKMGTSVVGHIPRNLNALFNSLLVNKLGTIEFKCLAKGKPCRGYKRGGIAIPCWYRITSDKNIQEIERRESICELIVVFIYFFHELYINISLKRKNIGLLSHELFRLLSFQCF